MRISEIYHHDAEDRICEQGGKDGVAQRTRAARGGGRNSSISRTVECKIRGGSDGPTSCFSTLQASPRSGAFPTDFSPGIRRAERQTSWAAGDLGHGAGAYMAPCQPRVLPECRP